MAAEFKRLYRSRTNRMIAGVAGGLGEYFGIDPTLVRLLFVVFAVFVGGGLLAYIIMWILIPEEPVTGETLEAEPIPPTDPYDTDLS